MSDSLFSVRDRVVLVSGGSRGIGRSLAEGFAQRGARVFISGREESTLQKTVGEISTGTHSVDYVVCDVAHPDAIPPMIDAIVSRAGRIDDLINVAGINVRKKVEQYTVEEFDKILNINMKGAFLVAQEVGRRLIAQRSGGSIINIDSLNSFRPLKGVQPYAMSKAAVSAMTRGMAMEWGEHGIRVNAIVPGPTEGTEGMARLAPTAEIRTFIEGMVPLRRFGTTREIANLAVFLAGPGAAYVTGAILYCDGGQVLVGSRPKPPGM